MKCLEQCGSICQKACIAMRREPSRDVIQMIISNQSQCQSACEQSCKLSCKNHGPNSKASCITNCQSACHDTCVAAAPPLSETFQIDGCCNSCMNPCQTSYLAKLQQYLLTKQCDVKCKKICNGLCKSSTATLPSNTATIQPPVILVQNYLGPLNDTSSSAYTATNEHQTLTTNTGLISCNDYCGLLCSSAESNNLCKRSCYASCYDMHQYSNAFELPGCRSTCPTACAEYCEKQKYKEQEPCNNECKKACALACNADIIKLVTKLKNKQGSEFDYHWPTETTKTTTTPINYRVVETRKDKGYERSKKNSNLRTLISVLPENYTSILDCQIQCVGYCSKNYKVEDCISGCQHACVEHTINEAKKRALVTTVSIGQPLDRLRGPQILPCKAGARPTGENCKCLDGYTQCGVNQCCRK